MKRPEKLKGYEEYLFHRELSEKTIAIYVRQAELLLAFLDGKLVSKKEVIQYKNQVQKKYKVSTRNLHITAINSYLRYLGYADCVVRMEKVQKRPSLSNVISGEEAWKMLFTAKEKGKEKYYCIIYTLLTTGMRIGELPFLTASALQKGRFQIENKGKEREVYLPDCLVEVLNQYAKERGIVSGPLFLGKDNKPLDRTTVYKALIRLAGEAGIPREKAHPHSFRHLFALNYMKQYGDLTELADILGHSSLETTRIYTTTTVEEKRRRLNELKLL